MRVGGSRLYSRSPHGVLTPLAVASQREQRETTQRDELHQRSRVAGPSGSKAPPAETRPGQRHGMGRWGLVEGGLRALVLDSTPGPKRKGPEIGHRLERPARSLTLPGWPRFRRSPWQEEYRPTPRIGQGSVHAPAKNLSTVSTTFPTLVQA